MLCPSLCLSVSLDFLSLYVSAMSFSLAISLLLLVLYVQGADKCLFFPLFGRYRDIIPQEEVPRGESLQMAQNRLLPLWHNEIAQDLIEGKTVVVAAHNNILRSLIMFIDG